MSSSHIYLDLHHIVIQCIKGMRKRLFQNCEKSSSKLLSWLRSHSIFDSIDVTAVVLVDFENDVNDLHLTGFEEYGFVKSGSII